MRTAIEVLGAIGARLRPGADVALIDRVAATHGITLPVAARALYQAANGSNDEFGEWSWIYWGIDSEDLTLDRFYGFRPSYTVGREPRAFDPRKYVRFFDCLINAPLYAYCADAASSRHGEVIGCYGDGGKFDAFVSATSVDRFLELFVESSGTEMVLVDEAKPA